MTYSDKVRAEAAYNNEANISNACKPYTAGYLAALAELAKASGVFSLAAPPPGHSFDGLVTALVKSRDYSDMREERAKDYNAFAQAMGEPFGTVTRESVVIALRKRAPVGREQQIAVREGEHWACSDPYFQARPEQDSARGRFLFEAGFTRGYDAAQGL